MRPSEGAPVQTVPLVPPDPFVQAQPGARGAVASSPPARRRAVQPARIAWERISAPLRERLGTRILFIGITGSGKTTGVKDYLAFLQARGLIEITIIHDVKKPTPQYPGRVLYDARGIFIDPPDKYPATCVLRKRNLDHMPSVDGAARVVMEMGYSDVTACLVIDEFQRALTDGGKFESAQTRKLFCEGLGLHASVIATKQMPQLMPTEATGQSAKVYFKATREGVNYLIDDRKISREHGDALLGLDVGEFTLVPEEGDFDGEIFRVPAP